MKRMVWPRFLNFFEKAFFTFTLFLLTDKFSHLISFSSRQPSIRHAADLWTDIPVNEIARAVRAWLTTTRSFSIDIAFWLVLLLLLLHMDRFAKIYRVVRNNVFLVVFFFLAGASWFWSIAPDRTLDGFFFLLKITVIGLYISQSYSIKETLYVLLGVIALASVLSILAIWQTPELGVNGPYWQGVYSFKNFLGRLMAFGNALLILFWFTINRVVFRRLLALVLFIFTAVLLIFSDSATSLVVCIAMYAALILYGIWRKWPALFSPRLRWPLALFGSFSAILAIVNYKLIFASFGRSSTLSGRTVLWEILWTWFQKKPIFGFGHDAFWEVYPDGLTLSGQVIRHAHNGYIDIALGLGVLGLILFVASLLIVWKRTFQVLRQKQQILYFWPMLALIYFTLANMTYSIASENPDFHWVLFVIVAGTITTASSEETREPSLAIGT